MKRLLTVLTATALSIGSVPMAAAQMKHGDMRGMGHGQSLNWPGMTMVFRVKDKAMLEKVTKDKKVEFELAQDGTQYVISSIK